MGVAVLHPQDCLKHPFAHMKYPRNPSACPNKQKKPISNRTRRSPPRNQSTRSSPPQAPPVPPRSAVVSASVPKGSVKKILKPIVPVRILKRGEEIPKENVVPVVEKSDLVVENSDLGSTRRIGPDPVMIPNQIRNSGRKLKAAPFYAGPVTMSSPPPSDVPLPGFFTTNLAATNNLMKMLRIDTA